MAKQFFPNQSDGSVCKSRQRPSWLNSLISASDTAFKIRHIVVAFQGKIKSLNSRRLQQKPRQPAVSCSKLLTLPLEIRLMIYDHVFTAHGTACSCVRLILSRNIYLNALWNTRLPLGYRITGYPCTGEETFFEFARAWSGLTTSSAQHITSRKRNEDANTQYRQSKLGAMALMLTCRALYHEVLEIFYAHRTWQFNDLDTIIVAAKHIPMPHFNNIRSLYFDTKHVPGYTDFTGYMWDLPREYRQRFTHLVPPPMPLVSRVLRVVDTGDVRKWQAACNVIAGMESLERLRIHLCEQAFVVVLECRRPSVQITGESFVFAPLTETGKRRDLELFEVLVDWPVGDDDAWAEQAEKEFTLVRLTERSNPELQ